MMRKLLYLHLSLLGFLPAQLSLAAMVDYKPLAIQIQPQDHILIKGFDGDVKVNTAKGNQLVVKVRQETSNSASSAVRQSLDEWNFSLQRGASGIELQVQAPQAKEVWRQVLASGGAPKFHLEISSPALPLDMAWRNGKVSFDGWNAPIKVITQEGSVQITGGQGDTKVIGQETEIRIKNRSGRVIAETYNGKMVFENIKGNLDVENFSGDTVISQNDGLIGFRTFKSPLTVTGGKGRLEFQTVRGAIKLTSFAGDLKGVSDEASVTANLSGASEVRVNTQSGPVSLHLPNSGASVSAASVEGGISGPPHMKSDQLAGQRVMRGRLKGSNEGSVVVRTQSGPIRIR